MDELNLDEDTTITNILNDAEQMILATLNKKDLKYWEDNQLFVRACYALATAMYYDRTLADGLPKGVVMLIAHLKGDDDYIQAED